MTNRRWDIDERRIGIADAQPFAPPVRELLQATSEPGWVTEDADAHLGVHLRRVCAGPGSPWTWIAAAQDTEGVFEIDLAHSSDPTMDVWREAVALLSTIAEQSIHVRRVDDQTFEAVTRDAAGRRRLRNSRPHTPAADPERRRRQGAASARSLGQRRAAVHWWARAPSRPQPALTQLSSRARCLVRR